MSRKRGKPSFSSSSKNVLWALLVVAAAVTVYGFSQAATVSHAPSEIVPQGAGSGFDSDLLQGLAAADFLSAGGGGTDYPLTLPKGYYIGYDWDRDGKSIMTGDCDEACSTCYFGSSQQTAAPDGKDQDCDGTIDDAIPGQQKSCTLTDMVLYSAFTSPCTAWCQARGAGFGSISCIRRNYETGPEPCAYQIRNAFDWNSCTPGSTYSQVGCRINDVCDRGSVTCICASGYQ